MGSSRSFIGLMATLNLMALTSAGPLGPLPALNLTSANMGLKEGNCALGDVVYMIGDEFPGSSPCERCACAAGGVRCAPTACEPRPGCKALHRPDHCCPTYQCECEQEGRVYGNGEKLVDPADPCRVCYCQGGEVVCRRIACFVRDDCTPRRVPGRCCPEYDNCPLRGVTSLLGLSTSTVAAATSSPESASPAAPAEVKPSFTIKEITPKAEIPIITDVKIKEILPSPSIEVAEYSSSKAPLIPREATSQKTSNSEETPKVELEMPSVVEIHSFPDTVSTEESDSSAGNKNQREPSKISLSTQASINSEIYPSPIVPIIALMGSPVTPISSSVVSATKTPVLEEEDPSLFDHNPAFPPLPDDFSNHGDDIAQEPSVDSDHMPAEHSLEPEVVITSMSTSTTTEFIEPLTTTVKYLPDTPTTEKSKILTELSTLIDSTSTAAPTVRENPTIKLRSAIPTEVFNTSSQEVVSSKVAAIEGSPHIAIHTSTPFVTESTAITSTTTEASSKIYETINSEKNIKTEGTTKPTENNAYEDIINSGEMVKTQEIMKSEETGYYDSSKSDEMSKLENGTISEEIFTAEPEAPIERVGFVTTGSESVAESHTTTQKIPDSTNSDAKTTEINKVEDIVRVTMSTEILTAEPKDPIERVNFVTTESESVAESHPTTHRVPEFTNSDAKTTELIPYEDIVHSQEIMKHQEVTTFEETEYSESRNSNEMRKLEKSSLSAEIPTVEPEAPIERVSFVTTESEPVPESQPTQKIPESTYSEATLSTSQERTTNSIAKSNIATEVTSQTELLSSLPIETSDQNPHESSVSENVSKDSFDGITTVESVSDSTTSTTTEKPVSSEIVTVPKTADSTAIENVETTEFILTSFGSSESSTDAVELIKIPGDADRNAAIIDRADGNKNALTDLIKLVSDVASMSDHTDAPVIVHQAGSTGLVDSEELLPINAGYKSKNSNFNQNSITEIPFKSKSVTVNKQKVVEIEDDESDITDSPPPNDKVEPTTRRPIIDNVSDDMPEAKTVKKDIEIITQSYVPTMNRRPTKVVLKADRPELTVDAPQDDAPASASAETATEVRGLEEPQGDSADSRDQ